MASRALRIQDILLLLLGGMALLIVLLAGRGAHVEWRRLNDIESLRAASILSYNLFTAIEKISIERDFAGAALRSREESPQDNLRPRLQENRQETDDAMARALQAFEQPALTALVYARPDIETHFSNILALRRQIDEALAVPLEQRDKTLTDRWYDETMETIRKTQDFWIDFVKNFTHIHPIVTQNLRYQHFLRIITDHVGRERAIIGRLLADNTDPTPEESVELLRGQGIMDLSWQTSHLLATQSGLYPSIASHYKDARSHYQTLQDMMRNIFYVPGTRHGASYPISVDLWLELSTQATESLTALRKVSIEQARLYVDTLRTEARRAIAVQGFIVFFAFGLCAFSFHIVIRRVIRPINTMVAALVNTMEGKPVTSSLSSHRNDEIGKLGRVLASFQASQERYRALVESSSQIVWVWKEGALDKRSPLSLWWEATTGHSSDMIATFGWLEVVHPDDRERVRKIWEDAMAERRNFDMEYRLLGRDGKYLHVAVRGVALLASDGAIREFIGTLNDVTQRKEAEAGLLSYMRALERSNKELDDFAYIASHDLKEPLRGIHNHSCFLLEDNQGKLDEESVNKLNRLVYLSQRMERLVNDLLYFSRLGRQELAIQSTDINEVIHDIEKTLELFLAERATKIIIPRPLPNVTCDKPRITELFRNLITNAAKYNDKAERIVEIGFQPLYVSADKGTLKNVFYVRDNGKGIAPEFHEDIFRIFKRLQATSEGEEEGTGVGLTFVKKIVERHGGVICLESEPGKGTTFYFTLEGKAHEHSTAETA